MSLRSLPHSVNGTAFSLPLLRHKREHPTEAAFPPTDCSLSLLRTRFTAFLPRRDGALQFSSPHFFFFSFTLPLFLSSRTPPPPSSVKPSPREPEEVGSPLLTYGSDLLPSADFADLLPFLFQTLPAAVRSCLGGRATCPSPELLRLMTWIPLEMSSRSGEQCFVRLGGTGLIGRRPPLSGAFGSSTRSLFLREVPRMRLSSTSPLLAPPSPLSSPSTDLFATFLFCVYEPPAFVKPPRRDRKLSCTDLPNILPSLTALP